MNTLENDDSIKNQKFEDYEEAKEALDEEFNRLKNNKIKGFQFFQEQHADRFKITKR